MDNEQAKEKLSSEKESSAFLTTVGTLFDIKEEFLSTGCANFDTFLRGGISCRGITQIYGAAGTGKTQLALQLCLTSQIPKVNGGRNAGAVYICTEAIFPSKRLQELMEESEAAKKFCVNGDSIFIEHISTIEDLESCILKRVPLLLSSRKMGVLIIDSIAAPYRVEYSSKELESRAKSLRSIGLQLHHLSKAHNIAVICINQVSAVMGDTPDGVDEQPTLGLTWANVVTNSIYFYKRNNVRFARVMKASYLPRGMLNFEIHKYGLKGIS